MFILRKTATHSLDAIEHIIALIESVIAFAATLVIGLIPPCSSGSMAVIFAELIGGMASYVRVVSPRSLTMAMLSILRIIAACCSLAIIVHEMIFGAATLWLGVAILRAGFQIFLSAITLGRIIRDQSRTTVKWQIMPLHTWTHIIAWFVAAVLTLALDGCGARPLLAIVAAPSVILAHISLCYDAYHHRTPHTTFLTTVYTVMSEWGDSTTTVVRKRSIADRAFTEGPITFGIFGIACGVVSIAQITVVFVFPIANVCLPGHPRDCDFLAARSLLAIALSSLFCLIEFIRYACSWMHITTHE